MQPAETASEAAESALTLRFAAQSISGVGQPTLTAWYQKAAYRIAGRMHSTIVNNSTVDLLRLPPLHHAVQEKWVQEYAQT